MYNFHLSDYLAITTPSTCMQNKTLFSTTVTLIMPSLAVLHT